MKHTITMLVVAGALGALSCSSKELPPKPAPAAGAAPTVAVSSAEPSAQSPSQIANPASLNCVEQGGTERNVKAPGGEVGVCEFSDGSRCDSWRLMRGECKRGECHDELGTCKEKAQ